MSRPMVRIHNIETDEIIDREMTAAEFEQYQKDQAEYLAKKADDEARKAEAEAKQAQRQALLSRLGITEEEARILLGGN